MELQLDWSKLRIGQEQAIRTIEMRFKQGEDFSAIVLPTRYGKSDVIRIAAMRLWHERAAGPALVLSPNSYLRRQMGNRSKFQACVDRCEIQISGYSIKEMSRAHLPFSPNGEAFLSVTIQLLNTNLQIFEQWVERELRQTGLRPMIFVDEAHTGSEDNSWGGSVKRLVDQGAHAVLLTATPKVVPIIKTALRLN